MIDSRNRDLCVPTVTIVVVFVTQGGRSIVETVTSVSPP